MPVNQKIGKNKGFAFITATEHVYIELVKVNGIEFKGKESPFKILFLLGNKQTSLSKIQRDHKLQLIDTQTTRMSKEEILFQVNKNTLMSQEHRKKYHKKKQIIRKSTIRNTQFSLVIKEI